MQQDNLHTADPSMTQLLQASLSRATWGVAKQGLQDREHYMVASKQPGTET